MPRLSIVVTYRNRNVERVKRFFASIDAQSYRDFELIFVDYGSDANFASAVGEIADKYTWCRHLYNDTRGMLWNKSHAINSGVRQSTGEYFLSTDIDLIYTRDVLKHAMEHAHPSKQLFSLAYMLPETFTQFETLETERPVDFVESPYQSIGMFHLLSNQVFQEKLGGLDEFYCIWGREDTDGYVRGRNAGLESYWMDNRKFPLYHQWHETHTASSSQFTLGWWEDVVMHFELRRDDIKRNQPNWGAVLLTSERKTINDPPYTTMILPKDMNPFVRSRVMADIIQFLKQCPGKVLLIKIGKERNILDLKGRKLVHKIGFKAIRSLNRALELANINLEMRTTNRGPLTSEGSFLYFLFNLIVKHSLVKEYYYSDDEDGCHSYKLCS